MAGKPALVAQLKSNFLYYFDVFECKLLFVELCHFWWKIDKV